MTCCCSKSCVCDEFKPSSFLFGYDKPECFVTAQCGCCPRLYVIYRVLIAVFITIFTVYSGIDQRASGPLYFIWLTHWAFLLLNLSCIIQAATALTHYCTRRTDDSYTYMPCVFKFQWVIYNLAITMAPVVSVLGVLYWWKFTTDATPISVVNFTMHVVNVVYVILDVMISAAPIRLLHFYQPMAFGFIYGVFSIVYWALGGRNNLGRPYIYSITDYGGDPRSAAAWLAMDFFVVLPMAQVAMFGVYKLRSLFFGCCQCACEMNTDMYPDGGFGLHLRNLRSIPNFIMTSSS